MVRVRGIREIDFEGLLARIDELPIRDQRQVVAIAGPPAAGKSTLAEAVRHARPERVAVLGLDAFHFDDAILAERSHRERKGAPFTFDVDGYRRCLQGLRTTLRRDVAVPVFDRDLELSRNGAAIVPGDCDVIVTEGNYLLLDTPGWVELAPLFDITVFASVPTPLIRQRLLDRWTQHGFDADQALERAEFNDLPNARLVTSQSRSAAYLISTG